MAEGGGVGSTGRKALRTLHPQYDQNERSDLITVDRDAPPLRRRRRQLHFGAAVQTADKNKAARATSEPTNTGQRLHDSRQQPRTFHHVTKLSAQPPPPLNNH